jgi:hypothetical protein
MSAHSPVQQKVHIPRRSKIMLEIQPLSRENAISPFFVSKNSNKWEIA